MIRVIRQAGMVDLFHLRVVGKVFHDLFGVLGMALHAQAQSLNTLQQQECVERLMVAPVSRSRMART